MSEQCQNYSAEFGCQQALGKGVCPKVRVERIWAGEPGDSDSIPKRIFCELTGKDLKEGINIRGVPPPNFSSKGTGSSRR